MIFILAFASDTFLLPCQIDLLGTRVDHVWIDWVQRMEALALCLMKRQEKELRTLPDAHHLGSDILVPRCQSVNPILQ